MTITESPCVVVPLDLKKETEGSKEAGGFQILPWHPSLFLPNKLNVFVTPSSITLVAGYFLFFLLSSHCPFCLYLYRHDLSELYQRPRFFRHIMYKEIQAVLLPAQLVMMTDRHVQKQAATSPFEFGQVTLSICILVVFTQNRELSACIILTQGAVHLKTGRTTFPS